EPSSSEEPQPDASSEEPQPDSGMDSPAPEPEPEPAAVSALADKKKLVPLIVMGVVGLSFLVLMIAVLAGA
ncbi:FHA domain-containing protein, partial [Corallococcus carmarthensis]|nr:FHA domain-containing protein [Corallococcus carmarthensis]